MRSAFAAARLPPSLKLRRTGRRLRGTTCAFARVATAWISHATCGNPRTAPFWNSPDAEIV